MSENRSIYQRLAAVAAEIGTIRSTGKTAQGQKTISTGDVENAVRPLFVKHGVLTAYTWNAPPAMIDIPTVPKLDERTGEVKETKLIVWTADLALTLTNIDEPKDGITVRLCDIGSSPSAAVSFALKRFLRALLHLSDESDEGKPSGGQSRPQQTGRGRERETRPASATPGSPQTVEPQPDGSARPTSGDGAAASVGPLAAQPPLASEDGEPPESRKEASARLNTAYLRSGMTLENLKSLSVHLFGKEKRDDLTDAELSELASEVEGIALSKAGAKS